MKEAYIRYTSSMSLNADSFLKSIESFPPTLQELRDLYIDRVLDMCEGNHSRAARILGIGRTTLYRYLKSMSIADQDEKKICCHTGT